MSNDATKLASRIHANAAGCARLKGMRALAAALLEALDNEALDELVARLAPRVAALNRTTDVESESWFNVVRPADYLACPRGRIYDLVQLGKLEPRRDGRRLLFRRDDLDRYLEGDRVP